MEQGAGVGPNIWRGTQVQVQTYTRVCIHERNVPAIRETRSTQDFVSDLHDLLIFAGVDGPYVLVGHSYGGFVARLYADQYPDQVAGMVLVESVHEDQMMRMLEVLSQDLAQDELDSFEQMNVNGLASFGIDWYASAAQVADTGSLGDILPLVVLTANPPANQPVYPPFTSETMTEMTRIISDELPRELASQSSNGSRIIVDGVNHDTTLASSEFLEAIQQVVEEVREQDS